jgi:hypothetical protein
MPNTLAHLGTQALATRLVSRHAPLLWIYAGAVLPDLPWILQRAIRGLAPDVDPATLRLYMVAQASLLGCLVLAAAVAMVARERRVVFALLASGALLHLLLDAVEVKWANGVVLLAPFDWTAWRLDWFWPETLAGLVWTLLGAAWVAAFWRRAWNETPELSDEPRRWLAGLALAAVWAILPVALMPAAFRADSHYVRTLAETEQRPGRRIELHRAHAYDLPEGDQVETLEDERLAVEGLEVEERQRISIRGRFVDRATVRVEESFVHPPGRDWASYLGLAAFGVLWARGLLRWWRSTERPLVP